VFKSKIELPQGLWSIKRERKVSIGVTRVNEPNELEKAVQLAVEYNCDTLCEELIEGDEVSCAVLGVGETARALPLVCVLTPSDRGYDYQNKYFSDDFKYMCPCGLLPSEEKQIQDIVLRAYRVLGCRGWGRADVMIRASDQQPFLLEMKTSPGMTEHSLVPMSAKVAGIGYEELCMQILECASLDYYKLQER
jgi:D-alanine-D-alanine ligase